LTLLYQTIHKKCLKKFDAIIEESDVDAILSGDTSLYDEEIITLVEEEAQAFVDSLLSSFREFQIDLKHSFVVFLGGGAILLKKYIEKSPLLGRYMFLEDIKGNVHGYKLLYQVMQKKKGEQS
jgi:plasmid segregation protein ParM